MISIMKKNALNFWMAYSQYCNQTGHGTPEPFKSTNSMEAPKQLRRLKSKLYEILPILLKSVSSYATQFKLSIEETKEI